jgi:tripartite-type tricarboxylate transporter receptor subunit TctC
MQDAARRVAGAWIVALGLGVAAQSFSQVNYPARPLRFIIPFPAGGAADMVGRTIGEKLTAQLGQSVVIDNRPGAGGILAAELLAKAEPDGYTALVGVPGAMVISPIINKRITYVPSRDFLPVTRVSEVLNVMVVNASTGVTGVAQFIEWAKKKGADVRFGSSGAGQPDHLAAEFFKRLTRLDMTHVPYKGGGPALVDLVSNQLQLMFATYIVARPHVKSGRLRAIAVITPERQPLLPDLPPVGETVAGFGLNNWNGIFVPARTPAAVADRLFTEINKALTYPDLKQRQNATGIEPMGSPSRAHFAKFYASEHARWGKIIQDAGIILE